MRIIIKEIKILAVVGILFMVNNKMSFASEYDLDNGAKTLWISSYYNINTLDGFITGITGMDNDSTCLYDHKKTSLFYLGNTAIGTAIMRRNFKIMLASVTSGAAEPHISFVSDQPGSFAARGTDACQKYFSARFKAYDNAGPLPEQYSTGVTWRIPLD